MDHFWGLLFIIVDLEPNDIQEMYAQMDADGSGTLDFDEFLLGTVGLTGLTFLSDLSSLIGWATVSVFKKEQSL